jgi:hypothetical protein
LYVVYFFTQSSSIFNTLPTRPFPPRATPISYHSKNQSVYEVTTVLPQLVYEVTAVLPQSVYEVTVVLPQSVYEVTVDLPQLVYEVTAALPQSVYEVTATRTNRSEVSPTPSLTYPLAL